MNFIPSEIWDLSEVAIIAIAGFYFFYRVIVAVMDRKKNKVEITSNGNGAKLLEQIKLLNTNHLSEIKDCIRTGDEKIVKAITDGDREKIALLGEIKGKIR